MLITEKFTPEVLIETPRRGTALPNDTGTLALYTVSTHTIGEDTLKESRVMDIKTGDSRRITSDDKAHDAVWLGDGSDSVLFLVSGDKGSTRVVIVDADSPQGDAHMVGEIPAPVDSLRTKVLDDKSIAFAVTGRTAKDGTLLNQELLEKKATSVRVYDTYRTRYWNEYYEPEKFSIWYSQLVKSDGNWSLARPLQNALPGSDLEAPLRFDLGDVIDMFDISYRGILFVAEDRSNRDPAFHGTSHVYYVPIDSYSGESTHHPRRILPDHDGSDRSVYTNPRFSPDASMVAFVRSSWSRLQDRRLCIAHLDGRGAFDVFRMVTGKEWTPQLQSFEFSASGHAVFITAQDCGRVGLYELQLQPDAQPRTVFRGGSVSGFHPLVKDSSDRLLVTSSSLVENSLFQIIDTTGNGGHGVVSSASKNGARLGLSPDQVSEFYFEGAGDYVVHSWIIKPRSFDETKKYPLALLVHGGPQGAWTDAWSTRWNLAAWAEQGYIVIAPNISGSVGFGLEHTERVLGSWGGFPYQDLVNCYAYIKDMPGLDLENAVAAGGSYGGYMMNWMNGSPLGRKFRTLVCHDGLFHIPCAMLMADGGAGYLDFNGPPYIWLNNRELEKWNPGHPERLKEWKTPMLVIHSDKDYRCPITEGLAAFNVCQAKGIPSRFVNFPDEGHFVIKEENSLQWHRLVFDWVNKWSGKASNDVLGIEQQG